MQFFGYTSGPKAKKFTNSIALRRLERAAFETLEQRRLLSTVTWTGNGGDGLWSDGQNWDSNAAPAAQDDVVLPTMNSSTTTTTATSTTIYLSGATNVESIAMSGSYEIAAAFGSNASITAQSITASADDKISTTLVSNFSLSLNIPDGGRLELQNITGSSFRSGFDKTGSGVLVIDNGSYHGPSNIEGGVTIVNQIVDGEITLNSNAILTGSGSIDIVSVGSTAEISPGMLGNQSTLSSGGSNSGTLNPSTLNLLALYTDTGSTFNEEILGTPSGVQNGNVISGYTALNSSTLQVSLNQYTPHNGEVFTLINNNGTSAINGTFNNLPEGATVTADGFNFTISYVGGSSGHDVTLTTVLPVDVWTGNARTSNWSDVNNWSTGEVPVSTQAVDLPDVAGSGLFSLIDLDTPVTIDSLTVEGTYDIADAGGTLAVNNGVQVSGNASIEPQLTLQSATQFNISGVLTLADVADADNGFGIVKSGTGTLFVSSSTYTGATTLSGGTLTLDGPNQSDITAAAGTTLNGRGSAHSITSTGAVVSLEYAGSPAAVTVQDGLSLDPTSTLDEIISQSSTTTSSVLSSGQVTVNAGVIDLDGATLGLSSSNVAPAVGTVITLIANNTVQPVFGTFNDLPEGAIIRANNTAYQISYVGGLSGQDVTLTRVIPTDHWTGGGNSENWSDAANWQGDTVPFAGDSVEFPVTVVPGLVELDVDAAVTDITFDGNWAVTAQSQHTLSVAGNINVNANDEIDAQLILQHDTQVSTDAFGSLSISSVSDQQLGYGIDKVGSGFLTLTGTNTYFGQTTVDDGFLAVGGVIPGNVVVGNNGRLGGVGEVGHLTSYGIVSVAPSPTSSHLTVDNGLQLGNSATFSGAITTYSNQPIASTLVVDQGPIDLGSAQLDLTNVGYTPQDGQRFTLISNRTGSAVTGRFAGIAEGDLITVGNTTLQISYAGGDSGQDVVATVISLSVPITVPITGPVTGLPVVTLPGTTPTVTVARPVVSTPSVRPTLSVVGDDSSTTGEAGLTYKWQVIRAPSGAKRVKFENNGTNVAKSTTARVSKAGTYVVECTITNASGNSTTTQVSIIVKPVETTLRLTPHSATVARGGTIQFGGDVLDQFKHVMAGVKTAAYRLISGTGTVNASGLFTAGKTKEHLRMQITIDDLTGAVEAAVI